MCATHAVWHPGNLQAYWREAVGFLVIMHIWTKDLTLLTVVEYSPTPLTLRCPFITSLFEAACDRWPHMHYLRSGNICMLLCRLETGRLWVAEEWYFYPECRVPAALLMVKWVQADGLKWKFDEAPDTTCPNTHAEQYTISRGGLHGFCMKTRPAPDKNCSMRREGVTFHFNCTWKVSSTLTHTHTHTQATI